MVGDAEVLHSEVLCGLDHLAQSRRTIAGGGMIVKHAAQILELHEPRQFAVLRRFDLAGVLPQFWIDKVEIEGAIQLCLIVDLRYGLRAFFFHSESILVERPAAGKRPLTDGPVVFL